MDISSMGSRNIGATNVARELGLKWGFLTLALDLLKGLAPAAIFRLLFPESPLGLTIVGLCSLLGHQFTPFLHFRGGKGVSTALGFSLAVSPAATFLALGVFLLTVYVWDFISLGSITATLSLPIFLTLFGKSGFLVVGSVIAAAFICIKHRENIQRIASGSERRWRERKR